MAGFPVESDGFRKAPAAFLDESRTRGHLWCRVVGNPGPLGMTKVSWVANHKVPNPVPFVIPSVAEGSAVFSPHWPNPN